MDYNLPNKMGNCKLTQRHTNKQIHCKCDEEYNNVRYVDDTTLMAGRKQRGTKEPLDESEIRN